MPKRGRKRGSKGQKNQPMEQRDINQDRSGFGNMSGNEGGGIDPMERL